MMHAAADGIDGRQAADKIRVSDSPIHFRDTCFSVVRSAVAVPADHALIFGQ
jgi:hypothetical protein